MEERIGQVEAWQRELDMEAAFWSDVSSYLEYGEPARLTVHSCSSGYLAMTSNKGTVEGNESDLTARYTSLSHSAIQADVDESLAD